MLVCCRDGRRGEPRVRVQMQTATSSRLGPAGHLKFAGCKPCANITPGSNLQQFSFQKALMRWCLQSPGCARQRCRGARWPGVQPCPAGSPTAPRRSASSGLPSGPKKTFFRPRQLTIPWISLSIPFQATQLFCSLVLNACATVSCGSLLRLLQRRCSQRLEFFQ